MTPLLADSAIDFVTMLYVSTRKHHPADTTHQTNQPERTNHPSPWSLSLLTIPPAGLVYTSYHVVRWYCPLVVPAIRRARSTKRGEGSPLTPLLPLRSVRQGSTLPHTPTRLSRGVAPSAETAWRSACRAESSAPRRLRCADQGTLPRPRPAASSQMCCVCSVRIVRDFQICQIGATASSDGSRAKVRSPPSFAPITNSFGNRRARFPKQFVMTNGASRLLRAGEC